MVTNPGRESLSRPECIRLLGTSGIGRVGLSIGSLPVILPVNYVVDGARIVFRSGPGSKLDAALRGAVVCVEVDRVDERWRSGWSVLVTGEATEVPAELLGDGVASLLVPWSADAGDRYVGVAMALVSGRRVGPVLLTA
jgi:nitroimidazol reductase NimA-like FMN-containing flavoprotein (pyridoxamine 5'-phosphate oxidase superfamily)